MGLDQIKFRGGIWPTPSEPVVAPLGHGGTHVNQMWTKHVIDIWQKVVIEKNQKNKKHTNINCVGAYVGRKVGIGGTAL